MFAVELVNFEVDVDLLGLDFYSSFLAMFCLQFRLFNAVAHYTMHCDNKRSCCSF